MLSFRTKWSRNLGDSSVPPSDESPLAHLNSQEVNQAQTQPCLLLDFEDYSTEQNFGLEHFQQVLMLLISSI